MATTAKLHPDELIFYDGDKKPWHAFPEVPTRGVVGCFVADRVSEWGLFVVVDYDQVTRIMRVIRPRLRIDSSQNGKVQMGQDAATMRFDAKPCTCHFYYGRDSSCDCGAVEQNAVEYQKTFLPSSDTEYQVSAESRDPVRMVYLVFMERQHLNSLDIPYTPREGSDS